MNNQPDSRFDWQGFLFFSRFIFLTLMLFLAANYGAKLYSKISIDNQILTFEQNFSQSRQSLEKIFSNRKLEDKQAALALSNPRKITDQELATILPKTGKVLAANLNSMKLTLYENGSQVAEYKIISKGKDGSRWQTPVGMYEVETKEASHFSSIGEVYMPYSMQFFGNFFIHGWPYYPGGKPVPLGYTGGCIRLATDDARQVFAFAERGTPLFVYDAAASSTKHSLKPTAAYKPNISSQAYLVADINTGEVFAEKNAAEIRAIASITKLITAIVANEAITYDRKIPITEKVMGTYGEKYFRKNDRLTATELLYPLLMQSDNGAAVALADSFGSKRFIDLMNEKAAAIGMTSTHFADPHGISENNISTAEDLFRLSRYLYKNQQYLLGITKTQQKTLAGNNDHGAYTVYNFNLFADRADFLGGKTGSTTAAKQTMITLFSYNDQADVPSTSTLAIIVLGSDNRKSDILSLYNWTLAALKTGPSETLTRADK